MPRLFVDTAAQRGVLLLIAVWSATPPLHAQSIAWVRQYAYSGDVGYGVATGPGDSAYVAGLTFGNLDGQHLVGWDGGFGDAYVTKTDSTGYNYGSRQLGTTFQEISRGVAADQLGNVFVVGSTEGPMFDFFKGGGLDGFYMKFDGESGATLASRQIGTSGNDECRAVAADGLGNAYLAGLTSGVLGASNLGGTDAFLIKSAASGPGWTRQFGTGAGDTGLAVAADSLGNVFVAGQTSGDLGGPNAGGLDAFVTKFDPNGAQVWSRQLGTGGDDEAQAAATDGLGNVYIAGYTTGDLDGQNAGRRDAFVSKYDASGALLWMRLIGTAADDQGAGVAVDGLGNIFVTGTTSGSLQGGNAGQSDAFVTKLSGNGQLGWTRQFGTTSNDEALSVAADGHQNVYISGRTDGGMSTLSSDFQGNGGSAFLLKIIDADRPGDLNFDGRVDAADYTRWRDGLGTTYGQNVYSIWKASFGRSNGAGALLDGLGQPAVPEPTARIVLLSGMAIFTARRTSLSKFNRPRDLPTKPAFLRPVMYC